MADITVKDLIEKLKEYPEDALIDVDGDDVIPPHLKVGDKAILDDNGWLEICKHCGQEIARRSAYGYAEDPWLHVFPYRISCPLRYGGTKAEPK